MSEFPSVVVIEKLCKIKVFKFDFDFVSMTFRYLTLDVSVSSLGSGANASIRKYPMLTDQLSSFSPPLGAGVKVQVVFEF